MTTRVVTERQPGDVYIGRAGHGEDGYFGNACVVGRACARCRRIHADNADAIDSFRRYFIARTVEDREFARRVLALKGRGLWCPGRCKIKQKPCHGDVIVDWLESST